MSYLSQKFKPDLDKLKHEWKTVAWFAASFSLEVYDQLLAPYMQSHQLVPAEYQWIAAIVIPAGFMLLRRWKNAHPDPEV